MGKMVSVLARATERTQDLSTIFLCFVGILTFQQSEDTFIAHRQSKVVTTLELCIVYGKTYVIFIEHFVKSDCFSRIKEKQLI